MKMTHSRSMKQRTTIRFADELKYNKISAIWVTVISQLSTEQDPL